MIEIRHIHTGAVLMRVESLQEADLRQANLRHADLRRVDLNCVDLDQANLAFANLDGALMDSASLMFADLSFAKLRGASLWSAHIRQADLSSADLRNAQLCGTELNYTKLVDVRLEGADFTDAVFCYTCISGCLDLHLARNLDKTQHDGPSYLDWTTIKASIHLLPDMFLLNIGFTQLEIEGLRQLVAQLPASL
jgi:uncharacterized protein YjbI with pentapeptide repeats